MKKNLIIIAAMLVSMVAGALVTFFATQEGEPQTLFVGTYNLRNNHNDDAEEGNGWDRRKTVIADMIKFENVDIFGTQEGYIDQLQDLVNLMPEYDFIGAGRDDGKEKGEHSAIFYNKTRFQLLNSGNFWLTDKDINEPSLGWDAACVRICSWGEFKDLKTKLRFFYFNLHMDHVGRVARREAAKLVMDQIKDLAGRKPAVLTGDFNVDQTDEIYNIFTESGLLFDSYKTATNRFAENGTFCDYKSDIKSTSRIDHVFLTKQFAADCYGVLTNAYWTDDDPTVDHSNQAPAEFGFHKCVRRTPSDHYPVFVKIHVKK